MTSSPHRETNKRPNAHRIYIMCGALCTLLTLWLALNSSRPAQAAQSQPPVRWAFYITYNPNSLVSLQANVQSLNYVSPFYYTVNMSGTVNGRDQITATNLIRNAGAKSLPMLQNTAQYNAFSPVLTDTARRDALVDQIDSLVSARSYDGITIDFEGLNPTDKPYLTAFMGELYERLHSKGKLVAMAVAPKTREITTGWAAVYDYAALAEYTDYIVIMAYDYHYAGGDPGPIAPLYKLRDTASYALARIPASKIVWGVGVYGYDWPTNSQGKSTGHAEYLTHEQAEALTELPGAISGYDEEAVAPFVRYTRGDQTREAWYEDRRSFEAKLDLIARYNMAGFGIWRLGQEDPGIWTTINGDRTPSQPSEPTNTPTARRTTPPTSTPTATATPAPPTATPTPVPPAACLPITAFKSSPTKLYFEPTGHSLGGIFLQYWQKNGGLPIFGYPLTEEFTEVSPTDGKPYKVQYFERNRFEYHPEYAGTSNEVLLGLLGVQALGNRVFPQAVDLQPGPYTLYFPQVKHTLNGPFLKYWQGNGGLTRLGYPVTEPILEQSSIDGKTYSVQYTERARLEYHPEHAGTQYEILLGLLGLDISPCR